MGLKVIASRDGYRIAQPLYRVEDEEAKPSQIKLYEVIGWEIDTGEKNEFPEFGRQCEARPISAGAPTYHFGPWFLVHLDGQITNHEGRLITNINEENWEDECLANAHLHLARSIRYGQIPGDGQ